MNKVNIQGILAIIIIFSGLYILAFLKPTNDIIIAITGLMGYVVGYYYGDSKTNAQRIIGGSTPPKDKDEK